MSHEIISRGDLEILARHGSVDRQNVEWMFQSPFVRVLREVKVLPTDAILDLGSHIGSFALVAAKEKQCRVIGLEPDPASLRLARANVFLNGLEHLVAFFPLAAGGAESTVPLYEAVENWGHTIIDGGGPYNALTGKSSPVRMVTLRGALDCLGTSTCRFMKFNIEGAEHAMFDAASGETLRRVDTIVGEIHYDLGNGNVDVWLRKLVASGFDVETVREGDLRAVLIARRT